MGKTSGKTRKIIRLKHPLGSIQRKIRSHESPKKEEEVSAKKDEEKRPKPRYVNGKGVLPEVLDRQLVFPILSMDKTGYRFIGTGFFINQFGWFITAKHVAIEDGKAINPFWVIQVVSRTKYRERVVAGFWYHPSSDICVGRLKPIYRNGKRVENPAVVFKKSELEEKAKVFTYAYPDSHIEDDIYDENFQIATFSPKYYHGEYVNTEHRDDSRLKGEFLHTTINLKGGASGGPVFDIDGYVLGINTSSFDMPEGEVPISYLTPIKFAFEVRIGNKFKRLRDLSLAYEK